MILDKEVSRGLGLGLISWREHGTHYLENIYIRKKQDKFLFLFFNSNNIKPCMKIVTWPL